MTTPGPDDRRLRELLADSVADIEPADRLAAITARTQTRARTKGSPMNRIVAIGGAVIGTAAVITGIAWAGGVFDSSPEQPPPAATPSPTVVPDDTGESPTSEPEESFAAGLYFVGETPQGPRLYREFQQVTGDSAIVAALDAITTGAPEDPDYTTFVSALPIADAAADGDVIRVTLDEPVRDRPQQMTEEQATLAVQQVVWTAQAAAQERSPVRFEVGGEPVDQVYGVPTAEPVADADHLDVLALVSLTTPAEGAVVSGGRLEVEGVANSAEANVPLRILRDGEVVTEDFLTAEGWLDRMYPFAGAIDVSDLEPGEYVLEAATADPSGGAEGAGPHVDTRTFEVR